MGDDLTDTIQIKLDVEGLLILNRTGRRQFKNKNRKSYKSLYESTR